MSYRETREMYKAVCTDSGQECEVQFKTDPSRPITGEKPRDIPLAKQSITMIVRALYLYVVC